MATSNLPNLSLTDLSTAEFKNTLEVVNGKNTVIDFWTTRCTRCPAALDVLNSVAGRSSHDGVQFVSIVCDDLDGARNIIERDDAPRWERVSHFFMDPDSKEEAKRALGFNSVPFYVVLNDRGEIVQKGGKRDVDLDSIPGAMTIPTTGNEGEEKKEDSDDRPAVTEHVFDMDAEF